MAKNWKKEYEELDERYRDYREDHWNCWDNGSKVMAVIMTVLLTIMFSGCILLLTGVFNSPTERLGLEDELARIHTLKYYPEFENCSIEYDGCAGSGSGFCTEGVEIYCFGLDDRDGFRTKKDKTPTEVLYFDGITLKDILFEVLG